MQARKLTKLYTIYYFVSCSTLYSDWAALVISGSKTKRYEWCDTPSATPTAIRGKDKYPESKGTVHTIWCPLSLSWYSAHQGSQLETPDLANHVMMTCYLRDKLESLRASYASPRHTLTIIRKAIVPSLVYAFAVTPCTKADLIIWDTMIGNVIKHKFKLWKSAPNAMIRENTPNFGLGAPSIHDEYHWRLTTALTSSLEDPSIRHRTITLSLLTKQVAHIHSLTREFLTTREGSSLHMRQQSSYCMRCGSSWASNQANGTSWNAERACTWEK